MDGDAGFVKWQIGEEWKSRACPRQVITFDSRQWIQLYGVYTSGHLALAGGLLDQPAIYINTMTLIASFYRQATSKD